MVATQLIAASAAAVLVPQFAGPVVARLPGGPIMVLGLAAAAIYFGSKMEGVAASLVVGAGAGLLVGNLASMFLGNRQQVTA